MKPELKSKTRTFWRSLDLHVASKEESSGIRHMSNFSLNMISLKIFLLENAVDSEREAHSHWKRRLKCSPVSSSTTSARKKSPKNIEPAISSSIDS